MSLSRFHEVFGDPPKYVSLQKCISNCLDIDWCAVAQAHLSTEKCDRFFFQLPRPLRERAIKFHSLYCKTPKPTGRPRGRPRTSSFVDPNEWGFARAGRNYAVLMGAPFLEPANLDAYFVGDDLDLTDTHTNPHPSPKPYVTMPPDADWRDFVIGAPSKPLTSADLVPFWLIADTYPPAVKRRGVYAPPRPKDPSLLRTIFTYYTGQTLAPNEHLRYKLEGRRSWYVDVNPNHYTVEVRHSATSTP